MQHVASLWERAKRLEREGDISLLHDIYRELTQVAPQQPAAWLKLAQVHLLQGRYRQGYEATMRATDAMLAGKRWRALPYVAGQWLQFDERTKVSELVRSADWQSDEVLVQAGVLAQRLWLADDHALALELLNFAMPRLSAHHLLHFSRGEVLNHLGRMDEAAAEYQRSINLQPGFPEAHKALAYHHPAVPPRARISAVQAALDTAIASGQPEDQVTLHYALFRELDRAGDYDDAWRHLSTATALRRLTQGHDADTQRAVANALMSEDVLPAQDVHTAMKQSARRPIFIVGMPRSGTTVVDRMFGNHPEVVSAGELNAFSRALSWEIDRFYEPPASPELIELAMRCDFDRVGERYRNSIAGRFREKTVLLDKNPLNVWNVGFIARALPEARIVCMIRGPMDACFSNLKELFAWRSYTYSYDLNDLAEHYSLFRELSSHWSRAFPSQYHEVSYEALVQDPESILGDAMRFCGLEPRDEFTRLENNHAPVSTASRSQVRQPLGRQGLDAWKAYAVQLEPLAKRLRTLGFDV